PGDRAEVADSAEDDIDPGRAQLDDRRVEVALERAERNAADGVVSADGDDGDVGSSLESGPELAVADIDRLGTAHGERLEDDVVPVIGETPHGDADPRLVGVGNAGRGDRRVAEDGYPDRGVPRVAEITRRVEFRQARGRTEQR